MLDYKLTKFSNGLKYIEAPMNQTKAMSLLVMVKAGSRYEKSQENGLAHFLEHMFFKGTKKRPKTLDIARDLDAVGAVYNAYTSEENTGFYVNAESSHFDLALDVLTDILYNSRFDEKEITKEKGVISSEISMIKDDPASYVQNVMKELLWPNQPLGRQVTGKIETVTNLEQQNFKNFWQNYYQPERMIVTVAGGETPKSNWRPKIENFFGKIRASKTIEAERVKENQKKPKVSLFFKETDQTHLIIGFRSIRRADPRWPILAVFNNLMGATMSSRLFIQVRERRGLCYYISSNIADFVDTGFWGAAAGLDTNRIEEALKVILAEFAKVSIKKVSDEELKRAKDNLEGKLYLDLEESMAVAHYLAEEEMFWGEILDPDDLIKLYQKVTAEDILKLAQEITQPKNLNLAIVGPYRDGEKFDKIMGEYK